MAKKLKILNLNAWLLPLRLSSHNTKRVDRIFKLIDELDPDVITLQEVWDVSYLNEFARKFSDYYLISKPNWLFNEAGLMTFSKHPVITNKLFYFKPTEHYKFIEKGAKKGFMVTKIDFKGKEINIVNTHLYCSAIWSTKKDQEITKNQYRLIEKVFKKSKILTILFGDFNMDYYELEKLRKTFKIPNKKPVTTVTMDNIYTNARLNSNRIYNRQLDYMLYVENGTKIDVNLKVLNKEKVSDHYPLYCEIDLA